MSILPDGRDDDDDAGGLPRFTAAAIARLSLFHPCRSFLFSLFFLSSEFQRPGRDEAFKRQIARLRDRLLVRIDVVVGVVCFVVVVVDTDDDDEDEEALLKTSEESGRSSSVSSFCNNKVVVQNRYHLVIILVFFLEKSGEKRET